MMPANPLCFVAMPFLPEFNYFYLFLQKYLGEHHQLQVERGDHRILTKPLIDKVREQIRGAHILIADISGANPNVLYEVGLAHAYGKPVLFQRKTRPSKRQSMFDNLSSFRTILLTTRNSWKSSITQFTISSGMSMRACLN